MISFHEDSDSVGMSDLVKGARELMLVVAWRIFALNL